MIPLRPTSPLFFFNDTATTEIYTLSLHDALPISLAIRPSRKPFPISFTNSMRTAPGARDQKSTRLNSSHLVISYAVFCLKKKKVHVLIYTGLVRQHAHALVSSRTSSRVMSGSCER